jgi:hypothetical protein
VLVLVLDREKKYNLLKVRKLIVKRLHKIVISSILQLIR